MHIWCVLPTSIKRVSKQENVSVVLLFEKNLKSQMDRFFCCPTNNIKALKIKIDYSIVTPTTPTRLNSIQLSASVADS